MGTTEGKSSTMEPAEVKTMATKYFSEKQYFETSRIKLPNFFLLYI